MTATAVEPGQRAGLSTIAVKYPVIVAAAAEAIFKFSSAHLTVWCHLTSAFSSAHLTVWCLELAGDGLAAPCRTAKKPYVAPTRASLRLRRRAPTFSFNI